MSSGITAVKSKPYKSFQNLGSGLRAWRPVKAGQSGLRWDFKRLLHILTAMAELIPILNKEEIHAAVARLARQISTDYKHHELVLIGVLKGAFVFLADLIRQLTIPVKLDFVCLSSYGDRTVTSGAVRIRKELEIEIKNKDVLIVEDIVDTGLSMKHLINYLKTYNPKSIRICTLIDKRERRRIEIDIDYIGHSVDRGFLVGYGLDCAEDYRYLPAIYHLRD